MNLSFLPIALLLVAQPCFSMKKQRRIIVSKDWQPKPHQLDAAWEIKLAIKGKGNWALLEQNRELMSELFKAEDLQRKSKQQTEVLTHLQKALDRKKDFPNEAAILELLVQLQLTIEKGVSSEINLDNDYHEILERNMPTNPLNHDYSHDTLLEPFLIEFKKSNREREIELVQNEAALTEFLNHAQTSKLMYDPAFQQAALDELAISTIPDDNTYCSVDTAVYRLKTLVILESANHKTLMQFHECNDALKKYFLPGTINSFMQILSARITILDQVIRNTTTAKKSLEKFIQNSEPLLLKKIQKQIVKIKDYIKTPNQSTAENLSKVQKYQQAFSQYLERLTTCPLIDAKVKSRLQQLCLAQEQFITLAQSKNDKSHGAFPSVPSENPTRPSIPKGYFPLCPLEILFHTQNTIGPELNKWKWRATLTMDPKNTMVFPEDDSEAHQFHFVSNSVKSISLEMIRQKRNSKKPYGVADGFQFTDDEDNIQWVKFEDGGDNKLYHSQHLHEFYLYNPGIDKKNAYLVQDVIAECVHYHIEITNESSDANPDPARDEK